MNGAHPASPNEGGAKSRRVTVREEPDGSRMTASDARRQFADVLNHVRYRGERIIVHRRGKDLVAIVPVGDVALLRAIEDRMDLDLIRQRKREPSIPWKNVKSDLGL